MSLYPHLEVSNEQPLPQPVQVRTDKYSSRVGGGVVSGSSMLLSSTGLSVIRISSFSLSGTEFSSITGKTDSVSADELSVGTVETVFFSFIWLGLSENSWLLDIFLYTDSDENKTTAANAPAENLPIADFISFPDTADSSFLILRQDILREEEYVIAL